MYMDQKTAMHRSFKTEFLINKLYSENSLNKNEMFVRILPELFVRESGVNA